MSTRPKTLQAHERLFSRVLHGRLATGERCHAFGSGCAAVCEPLALGSGA